MLLCWILHFDQGTSHWKLFCSVGRHGCDFVVFHFSMDTHIASKKLNSFAVMIIYLTHCELPMFYLYTCLLSIGVPFPHFANFLGTRYIHIVISIHVPKSTHKSQHALQYQPLVYPLLIFILFYCYIFLFVINLLWYRPIMFTSNQTPIPKWYIRHCILQLLLIHEATRISE